MAQRFLDDIAVGTILGPISFGPITTRQLVQWCAAADDFYEIHYDKEFALAQGLPDVVVHGPLKLALMGRLLMDLAGSQGWIKRMNCRYLALDVPGSVLNCTATVTAVRLESGEVDLDLALVNEKEIQSALGAATVQLPWRQTGQ
ncbi:MAG: hypothetical protein M1358_01680 [Chloroflexi bacterium]|nr:hypothetical protein [Chloroflexota bacterium]